MSHFNLGEPSRKKFIGPQHRLGTTRATTMNANLENIGGRILVENEMLHHKLRIREVKASVDVGLPWAHRQQQKASSRVAHRLHEAAESDHKLNIAAGGSRPQSASVARPMTASSAHTHRSHTRPTTAASSSAPLPATEEFDPSTLTTDQQSVYRDMLRVLCQLDASRSKALLEQLYRESEEKKLLLGYTGVFPDSYE